MEGLAGLRTLVTGAAGGIGQAVVQRLAAEGAHVAAGDLEGLVAQSHKAELALEGDVTDEADAARLVAEATAALGGLDALVLAGIHWVGPTHEMNLTRSVAAEYAGRGIRANCLCPGATDTPLLRRLQADRPDPEAFARAHPIGRYAAPSEIAAATAFLLSDDASFFVGSAVVADGGFTAV